MSIVKHIHKLHRHEHTNGEKIYFCVLDCDYKIKVALALGKTTICNKCGKSFALNPYALRLAKPICLNCKVTKNPKIDLDEVFHGQTEHSTIEDDTSDLLSRLRSAINHGAKDENEIDEDLI